VVLIARNPLSEKKTETIIHPNLATPKELNQATHLKFHEKHPKEPTVHSPPSTINYPKYKK
jgi:hypothetical protein